MKKIILILVILLMSKATPAQKTCLSWGIIPKEKVTELGLSFGLTTFKSFVEKAKKELPNRNDITVNVEVVDCDFNGPAWTVKNHEAIPAFDIKKTYTIYIWVHILRKDEILLENMAFHEICHIKLGHQDSFFLTEEEREKQAINCSFETRPEENPVEKMLRQELLLFQIENLQYEKTAPR